ncbi:MAG TPA: tetratricopeptide repeat protein [Pyrinomonadaceae bacterium]|jgi:Flp pilus assembly protein TadD|nr:tetratricopeptide repeat protein [Pyrinomonadaceae bacterium]
MNKNFLLCVVGLALGFGAGFFLANKVTGGLANAPQASAPRAAAASDSAPPLAPDQAGAPLPPGHPDVSGATATTENSNPNGVAATSLEVQDAMEAADSKPKDFDLQMTAANTFARFKATDKATLYLERAVKLKPKDTDALIALANTKYDAGDYPAAARFYERALAVQPQNPEAQTDLGNTYFLRQPPDFKRAIKEYRKTLKLNPRHEKALQNIAAAAIELGDKATARDTLEQLSQINPNNTFLEGLRAKLESQP